MLFLGVDDLPRPADEIEESELADLGRVKLGDLDLPAGACDLACGCCLDFFVVVEAAAVAAAAAETAPTDLLALYTVSFVMSRSYACCRDQQARSAG